MRNLCTLSLFFAALLLLAACDNANIVQPTFDEDISQDTRVSATASIPDAAPVPGQFIVVLEDPWRGEISERVAEVARELIRSVRSDFAIPADSVKSEYEYALRGFTARMSDETVERLRADRRVNYVVQDWKTDPRAKVPNETTETAPSATASSTSQTTPWGVRQVNGPMNGTGKTAWVLDTGVDLDHRDLNVDKTRSASFIAEESANDYDGHGTHVAGSLAAINNDMDVVGVAAGAAVVSVKVLATHRRTKISEVVDGVNYAASNASPEDVINMSLGFPTWEYDTDPLDAAVENAADSGLRFVIAAQNWGMPADLSSPGRVVHDNVWTISAYDDTDTFASFSNYGNPPISYSGPGVDIPSLALSGGVTTTSGTSMAAAHIAGLLLASPAGIKTDGYVSDDPSGEPDPIAVADRFVSVSISGPLFMAVNEQGTWAASVSDGDGNYSYEWHYRSRDTNNQWDGPVSTSSSYSTRMYDFDKYLELRVRVVDGEGRVGSRTHYVNCTNCSSDGDEPLAADEESVDS